MIIKWINRFSGETGYVRNINRKGEYFENTFDREQARDYKCKNISRIISVLGKYCPDNTYTAE